MIFLLFLLFISELCSFDGFLLRNGLLNQHQFGTKAIRSKLSSKPSESQLKVLLLVEPTPFNYVSGYANRFKEMMKHLKRQGDSIQVVTPDPDPLHPNDYLGFPITTLKGFQCPYYNHVTLSIDTRFKTGNILKTFKPDILHVSTPSVLIFPAIYWARKFNIPLVMSYHTNVGEYAKSYFPLIPPKIIEAVNDCYMKFTHKFADLILCTSPQLKEQMIGAGLRRVDVWQKGINTEVAVSMILI
jgi:sulfoquinovosyltransferase